MPSLDCIILIIFQGDKVIHEGPGFFDIWTFLKEGGPAVSVRDVNEDEVIFEELPIESMSMSAPLVCIQIKRE